MLTIFPFPAEVKTLELRTNPRHHFGPQIERTVSFRPSIMGKRESGSELQVRALDISEQGLGLLVSEQNRSFLKNNRILWITRLQNDILEYPVLAEVVYLNSEVDARYLHRKQKELKVGLKLSGSFPEQIYHCFIQ